MNNGKNVCSTNKYSLFILNIECHYMLLVMLQN